MKCKHYKGDGYTYPLSKKESIDICEDCEKVLRREILEQKGLEEQLILPVRENMAGQKRVTIPKESKIKDKDYVEVKKVK